MAECYSIISWIQISKSIISGTNSCKTSPRFKRVYSSGPTAHQLHAEMDCINKASKIRDLKGSDLFVMRFKRDGSIGNAQPCKFCMEFIKEAGIKRVFYTDETGTWQKLKIQL